MRAIKKQSCNDYHLAQAHQKPPQTQADATSRWSSYAHKAGLQPRLLAEQYYLCCYSEIRADKLGLGYHIEHIEPKSNNPQRTFDYNNLAVSALDSSNDLQSFKIQGHETFGGHFKLGDYNPDLFISCHQVDCARFFRYLSDGRIEPAIDLDPDEHAKAEYTIKLLNLDCSYLQVLRRNWWDELDDLFWEHQEKGWSIEELAKCDLLPAGRKLSQFFSLTRQFFAQAGQAILEQNAPELL